MSDKLGEVYDGTIASVTQFGIFVRLDEVYVEGLVHVTSLPSDYYHYEPEKHRLKGERTGMSYRLGDGVTVQVARVDLDERKIDFELADDKPRPKRAPRRRRAVDAAPDKGRARAGGKPPKAEAASEEGADKGGRKRGGRRRRSRR